MKCLYIILFLVFSARINSNKITNRFQNLAKNNFMYEREYQIQNSLPKPRNDGVVVIDSPQIQQPLLPYYDPTPLSYTTPMYKPSTPIQGYIPTTTYYTSTSNIPQGYAFYPNKITYTPELNVYNPLFSRQNQNIDTTNSNKIFTNSNFEKLPSPSTTVNTIAPPSEIKIRMETETDSTSRFQDVINEIKTLKVDLFGNSQESMDFYKRNRNAYDSKMLQRSIKIAKILELEELLEFYNNNNKNSENNNKERKLDNEIAKVEKKTDTAKVELKKEEKKTDTPKIELKKEEKKNDTLKIEQTKEEKTINIPKIESKPLQIEKEKKKTEIPKDKTPIVPIVEIKPTTTITEKANK